jgi:exo-beta-1,3-glucanase (GH17 family)
MNLLLRGNWTLIRLFDSSTHAQRTLKVISDNNLDIKVQLGVWISWYTSTATKAEIDAVLAENQAEIARAISLATNPSYKDMILTVSVGNETMVDWSGLKVPPATMAGYIEQVRSGITQPVTTDDNWEFYSGKNESNTPYETKTILDVIDFACIHTYALADSPWGVWDWKQLGVAEGQARADAMMAAALASTKEDYTDVKNYFDKEGYKLPIAIGETGWKSAPSGGETMRAHPVNQKMYYDALFNWVNPARTTTGPVACFYFEAFDEPWKGGDDMWGLFTVGRKAKYVIWDKFTADSEREPTTDLVATYYKETPPFEQKDDNFVLYSETVTGGNPAGTVDWNVWNGTASLTKVTTNAYEGSECQKLSLIPGAQSWGWGFGLQENLPHENLSAYAAGYLVFAVKTTYADILYVGFQSVLPYPNNQDAIVALAAKYGYANDGAWHQIVIPVADLLAAKASAKINDVFTGFALLNQTKSVTTAADIYFDNVYWTKTLP